MAPCCDLGRADDDRDTPLPPTPRRFRDALGFTYRLCEVHYRVLTRVLLAHERACSPRAFREHRAAPVVRTVTGDDQRRARTEAGLSQRQLAALVGCTRSQVANAEQGAQAVAPVAAAWVVATLGA